MAHHSAKVMLAGAGHAGAQAVLTAIDQFNDDSYAFMVIDTPREIQAIDDRKSLFHAVPMDDEWEARLPEMLKGLEMLLVIAGLGGKTALDATKALETAAAAANLPVILLVTTPFEFEGEQRKTTAMKALASLRQNTNATIVIPNNTLFGILPEDTNAMAAFEQSDALLAEIAISLLRPFTFANLINIRKENIDWLLKRKNATVAVGIGWGEGEEAITEAVQQLSASPFLKPLQPTAQADAALVMVCMPEETTYSQLNGCLNSVKRLFAANIKLEIGACQDASLGEGVRIVTLMRYPNRPAAAQQTAPATAAPNTASGNAPAAENPPAQSAQTDSDAADRQLMLPIAEYSTGIFDKSNPTKYNFENLDIPTYLRRNVPISQEGFRIPQKSIDASDTVILSELLSDL